jgi:hypothetical protein
MPLGKTGRKPAERTVFGEMAELVVDRVGVARCQAVPDDVLRDIIRTCADVAEERLGIRRYGRELERPPATIPMRSKFLRTGDYVWRPDFAFDVVARTETLDDTFLSVWYIDGGPDTFRQDDHLRVAVSRERGSEWNRYRSSLDNGALQQLAETYGVFV